MKKMVCVLLAAILALSLAACAAESAGNGKQTADAARFALSLAD